MKFTFVSLFPNLIQPYFGDSILKRAVDKGIIELNFLNPRDFTANKYKKVDDYMIGGGAGLLIGTEPLARTLDEFKKTSPNAKIIYLTPVGKKFTQNDAKRLAGQSEICFICGRYEGIDERIIEEYVSEVFCIGDFVLTGGELGALCMSDAISRNLAGVLGNTASLDEESFEDGLLEAPSFTKPDIFKNLSIISEFLKGNHAKMHSLKNQMALMKTRYFRVDMYRKIAKK